MFIWNKVQKTRYLVTRALKDLKFGVRSTIMFGVEKGSIPFAGTMDIKQYVRSIPSQFIVC